MLHRFCQVACFATQYTTSHNVWPTRHAIFAALAEAIAKPSAPSGHNRQAGIYICVCLTHEHYMYYNSSDQMSLRFAVSYRIHPPQNICFVRGTQVGYLSGERWRGGGGSVTTTWPRRNVAVRALRVERGCADPHKLTTPSISFDFVAPASWALAFPS